MYKNMISMMIFLALTISCPAFASSGAEEPAEQPSEPSEEVIEESSGPLDSGHGWQLIRSQELGNNTGKFVHMVLVDRDKTSDTTVYSSAIKRICGDEEEFCRIRFWNQEKYIPEKITLNAEQSKNLLVEYTFNKAAGIHHTRWSCSVNPSRQDCFNQ